MTEEEVGTQDNETKGQVLSGGVDQENETSDIELEDISVEEEISIDEKTSDVDDAQEDRGEHRGKKISSLANKILSVCDRDIIGGRWNQMKGCLKRSLAYIFQRSGLYATYFLQFLLFVVFCGLYLYFSIEYGDNYRVAKALYPLFLNLSTAFGFTTILSFLQYLREREENKRNENKRCCYCHRNEPKAPEYGGIIN